VTGQVLDPAGKPVADAPVAVLARQGLFLSSWEGWTLHRNEVAAQARTDTQGRFRFAVPRPDENLTVRQIRVVAVSPGHGLAWKAVDPNAGQAEVELRLTPEQSIRGHFLDLQGQPASDVPVHVIRVTRQPQKGEREGDAALRVPGDGLPFGPRASTDARGEFVLHGFGPGLKVELEVRDPRYERKDEWIIDTGNKKECENLRLVLPPGQFVEGRVIYQDTGKPVPHARLEIANPVVGSRTDAEGKFRVTIFPARAIGIHVYPPAGEPYLHAYKDAVFAKGVVRQQVEIALPRGVLVRGKVTEAGSGKPVAGAYVEHTGVRGVHVKTGPDGSYQIGVPTGAGRLLVVHPSGEYIPEVLGTAELLAGKKGGDPVYQHAIVPLDIKADEKTREVPITLRRGVTVKGRVVKPDGRPVEGAVLFVSSHRPRYDRTMHPAFLPDGRFEVRGCDPAKSYRLVFLERARDVRLLMGVEALNTYGQLWLAELLGEHNKRGAVVEVQAGKAAADEPVVVKLAPCGSARVRFLDGAGKPLANYQPWLQLVVTPGPPVNQALADGKLAAEVVTLISQYAGNPPTEPHADADGYLTLHGLIPGATYRFKKPPLAGEVIRDFTAEAGKTIELEVRVK
jgi:protocatechuate 3,4-dioxygenase beta subunit